MISRYIFKFKGFTLVEMLTSIGMIVIIATLFIANYRSANKRTDLTMAAQTLVADLHLAQNNALGLVKYNGEVPAGGWGVNFTSSSTSYMLFADLNAPDDPSGYMDYDEGEGDINYGARLRTLPPNIKISNLKTAAAPSKDQVNVTFLPPDPQTNIYDSAATSSSLEIQLTETMTNTVKTVVVNFLGLIEVKD